MPANAARKPMFQPKRSLRPPPITYARNEPALMQVQNSVKPLSRRESPCR